MTSPQSSVTASPAPTVRAAEVDRPDVSIVVVAFGTGRVLIDSLASICDATEGYDVEVIVVSNPHPVAGQRSATELRLFTAGVRLLEPDRNLGFGGGCEYGALVARGDVLAFVNPDVIARPGWLGPLVDVVRRDDGPVIAAPVMLEPDGRVQEAGQSIAADGTTSAITTRPAGVVDVDYASAACWVMRRDVHEALGGFDPAYHPAYFEDVDLAWRCRTGGGRCVVVGSSSIVHDRGKGTLDQAPPADAQLAVFRHRWPEVAWHRPQPNSASTSRLA